MLALETAIADRWPITRWRSTRVLVGVSGGADSVALLLAMRAIADSPELVEAAHFNHRWRDTESDGDAAFVRSLCANLGCKFYYAAADANSKSEVHKSEESARNQRYRFLASAAYQAGCRYILTAHTASDRIETLLHNLFRGTGLSGVAAPQFSRAFEEELVLVRPLIGSSRWDVLEYLRQQNQGYREDSSNADLTFRRNYIRQSLLPAIREQYGESVDQRLLSFSELAEEANEVFREYAVDYLEEAEQLSRSLKAPLSVRERSGGDQICLPVFSLLPKPWPVVRQAIAITLVEKNWPQQALSRLHWLRLRKMMESLSSENAVSLNLPGRIHAACQENWILLTRGPESHTG